MTPEAVTTAFRFVHYLSTMVLFGMTLFPLCVWRGGASAEALRAASSSRTVMVAAVFATGSGIALLVCITAAMAGSWSDLDAHSLASVVTSTVFGRVWAIRLALAASLTALCLWRREAPPRSSTLAILSGILLCSIAGTGHAQDGARAIRAIHIVADALHLLAAGAWLGGLAALFLVVNASIHRTPASDVSMAIRASTGFSGLGYVAVATLLGTGLVNSWVLVGSAHALVSTAYGRMLCLKLILFATMLLLAGLNRFSIVPNLLRQTAAGGIRAALARLRWHVVGEQFLGAAVILIVSILGTMEPAINAGPS